MIPRAAALASGSALAVLLAACGNSGGGTVAPPAPAATTPSAAPGTAGLVAAVTATSLEVQNPASGQIAVDFTGATRITQQRPATLHAVTKGECVTATGTPNSAGTGLTARTVTVRPAVGGSCAAGRFGGGPGARPSGVPRPRPSGGPGAARPSGAPGGAALAAITGTVTGVSGATITVDGALRAGGSRPSSQPASRSLTVTTAADTRITATASVPASALKVGECVAAVGPSNDLGAVQATSISIFASGATGCELRRGPAGGAGGGNG